MEPASTQLTNESSNPKYWGGIEFALGMGVANYYLGCTFLLIDLTKHLSIERSTSMRIIRFDLTQC